MNELSGFSEEDEHALEACAAHLSRILLSDLVSDRIRILSTSVHEVVYEPGNRDPEAEIEKLLNRLSSVLPSESLMLWAGTEIDNHTCLASLQNSPNPASDTASDASPPPEAEVFSSLLGKVHDTVGPVNVIHVRGDPRYRALEAGGIRNAMAVPVLASSSSTMENAKVMRLTLTLTLTLTLIE